MTVRLLPPRESCHFQKLLILKKSTKNSINRQQINQQENNRNEVNSKNEDLAKS